MCEFSTALCCAGTTHSAQRIASAMMSAARTVLLLLSLVHLGDNAQVRHRKVEEEQIGFLQQSLSGSSNVMSERSPVFSQQNRENPSDDERDHSGLGVRGASSNAAGLYSPLLSSQLSSAPVPMRVMKPQTATLKSGADQDRRSTCTITVKSKKLATVHFLKPQPLAVGDSFVVSHSSTRSLNHLWTIHATIDTATFAFLIPPGFPIDSVFDASCRTTLEDNHHRVGELIKIDVHSSVASAPYKLLEKDDMAKHLIAKVSSVTSMVSLNGLWLVEKYDKENQFIIFRTQGVQDGTYFGHVHVLSSHADRSDDDDAMAVIRRVREEAKENRILSTRVGILRQRDLWLKKEEEHFKRRKPREHKPIVKLTKKIINDTIERIYVPRLRTPQFPKPEVILPLPTKPAEPQLNCSLPTKASDKSLPGSFSLLFGSRVVHSSCDVRKILGANKMYERIQLNGAQYSVLEEPRDNHTFVLGDDYCGPDAIVSTEASGLPKEEVDVYKDWMFVPGKFKVVRGSDIVCAEKDPKPFFDNGECIRLKCNQFTILTGGGKGASAGSKIPRTCSTSQGNWVQKQWGYRIPNRDSVETAQVAENLASSRSNGDSSSLKGKILEYVQNMSVLLETSNNDHLGENGNINIKPDLLRRAEKAIMSLPLLTVSQKTAGSTTIGNCNTYSEFLVVFKAIVSNLKATVISLSLKFASHAPTVDMKSDIDDLKEILSKSSILHSIDQRRNATLMIESACSEEDLVLLLLQILELKTDFNLDRNKIGCQKTDITTCDFPIRLNRPWKSRTGYIPAYRIKPFPLTPPPTPDTPTVLPGAAFPYVNVVTLSSCELFLSPDGSTCTDDSSVLFQNDLPCNNLTKLTENFGKLKRFCACEIGVNECKREQVKTVKTDFNGNPHVKKRRKARTKDLSRLRKAKGCNGCNSTVPKHSPTLHPEAVGSSYKGYYIDGHGAYVKSRGGNALNESVEEETKDGGSQSIYQGEATANADADAEEDDDEMEDSRPWSEASRITPVEKEVAGQKYLIDPRTNKVYKDTPPIKRPISPWDKVRAGQTESAAFNGAHPTGTPAANIVAQSGAPAAGAPKCGNMDPWNPIDALCKMIDEIKSFQGPGGVISNWIESLSPPDKNPKLPKKNFGVPSEPPFEDDGGATKMPFKLPKGKGLGGPAVPSLSLGGGGGGGGGGHSLPNLDVPSPNTCPCAASSPASFLRFKKSIPLDDYLKTPERSCKTCGKKMRELPSVSYVGALGPTYQSREFHGGENFDGAPAYQYKLPRKDFIPPKNDAKSTLWQTEHIPGVPNIPSKSDDAEVASAGDVSNAGFNDVPTPTRRKKKKASTRSPSKQKSTQKSNSCPCASTKSTGKHPSGPSPMLPPPPKFPKRAPGGTVAAKKVTKGAVIGLAKAMLPSMPPLPPFIPAPTLPQNLGLLAMIPAMSMWSGIPIVGQIAMGVHMSMSAARPMSAMPSGLKNPMSAPQVEALAQSAGVLAKTMKFDGQLKAGNKLKADLKKMGIPGFVPNVPVPTKKCSWNPTVKRTSGFCPLAKCTSRKANSKSCLNKIYVDKHKTTCCKINAPTSSTAGSSTIPAPPSSACVCKTREKKAADNVAAGALEASRISNSMRFAELKECSSCQKKKRWTSARLLSHEYDAQKAWNATQNKWLHHLALAVYNYGEFVRRQAPIGSAVPCQPFRILNFRSREDALKVTDHFKANPRCPDSKVCGTQKIVVIGPPAQADSKRATCEDAGQKNQLHRADMQRPLQLCDLVKIGTNPWAVYRVMEVDKDSKAIRIDRPYLGEALVEGHQIQLMKILPAQQALQRLAEKKSACADRLCITVIEKQEEEISLFIGGRRNLVSSISAAFNSAIGDFKPALGHPPVHCDPFALEYENKHRKPSPSVTGGESFTSWEAKNHEFDEEDKKEPEEVVSGSRSINSPVDADKKLGEDLGVDNYGKQDLMQQ